MQSCASHQILIIARNFFYDLAVTVDEFTRGHLLLSC